MNPPLPSVTVIIPCFNVERFVRQTLASIFAQTRQPDALILIDDGSTDATLAVVEDAVRDAPIPTRVLQQTNQGVGVARAAAIRAAETTYVLPVDADDILLPDALARWLAYAAQHPEHDLIYGDYIHMDESGTPGERVSIGKRRDDPLEGAILATMLWENVVSATSLLKREAVERIGGYVVEDINNQFTDVFLGLRLLVTGSTFGYVPEPMFYYRAHPNNMSKNRQKVLQAQRAGFAYIFRTASDQVSEAFLVMRQRRAEQLRDAFFTIEALRQQITALEAAAAEDNTALRQQSEEASKRPMQNEHEQQAARERAEALARQNSELEREAEAAQRRAADAEAALNSLRGTKAWRAVQGWWSIKQRLTIHPAKRWRVRQLANTAMYMIRYEGVIPFLDRSVRWLRGERRNYSSGSTLMTPRIEQDEATPWLKTTAFAPVGSLRSAQAADAHPLNRLPENVPFFGISIIIPVYNALDYLKQCLDAIFACGAPLPFEVIIIDNHSEPDVMQHVSRLGRQHPNLYWQRNHQNLGFAGGINEGLKLARGQYIALVNSDTVPTTGWLHRLIAAAEADPSLGILSPCTNSIGEGPQLDAAAIDLRLDEAESYARQIAHRSEIVYPAERIAFFCVLIRRQVYHLLGGLYEGFGIGNFEDEDYCVRARLIGFRLAVVMNSFVYHFGSKTFAANGIDHSRHMRQNYPHYLRRVSDMSSQMRPHPRRHAGPPLVSVIMRTANRRTTLPTALTSLANQTFRDFEVVIVNDGELNIDDIIDTFSPYLDVRSIRNTGSRGPSGAFNAGLAATQADWVSTLDDDDVWYPFHLESLWQTLQAHGGKYRVAYSSYNVVLFSRRDGTGIPLLQYPMPNWTFDASELLVRNRLPIHSWMQARECFEKAGTFVDGLYPVDDWDYIQRCAQHYEFVPTGRISAEYRIYLIGSSALLAYRQKALAGMRRIYERSNVSDPAIRAAQQRELRLMQMQTDEIARLAKIQGDAAEAQILHMIHGFSLKTLEALPYFREMKARR